MSTPSQQFISSFQSLTGDSIGERRKNLFILLQTTRNTLKENEDLDLSLLHPRNPLEETFKVDTLIYFQKPQELLEVLKNENPILIQKVLQAGRLLLEQTFENTTGDDLANLIFPQLSFNTKLKLLNKLAGCLRNTHQAEDFFHAILRSYGLNLASKLLPGCSALFILKSLKLHRFEVTPRQLTLILDKYPDLLEELLVILHETKSKVGVGDKYRKIFVGLIKRDVSLFLKLNEKYKPDFCLGHRATKRFIRANKESSIRNSKQLYKLLNVQEVGKLLQGDFDEFYFNLFPTSLARCKEDYEDLLGLLEHASWGSGKVKVLLKTFKKIYGNELWQHSALVTQKLLELMQPDERESWIETHPKPSEISEEQWISFRKIQKSLPILKERISLTSNIKVRTKMVTCLVLTCKVNKDMGALRDVCEFVATRHRNDHFGLRQEFLKTVRESFDLAKLQEEHWVHLNELVQLGIINKEYYYGYCFFLSAYIGHALKKNLPIKDELVQWVRFNYSRLVMKDPKHEKQCLVMMEELIPIGAKDEELDGRYIEYLTYVMDWNHAHPNDQVPLLSFTGPLKRLKSSLERHRYFWMEQDVLMGCIKEDFPTTAHMDLLPAFFNCKRTFLSGVILKLLLIHEPSFVVQNINIITKSLLRTNSPKMLPTVWRYCRNYSHLGVPQKMSQIYLEVLNAEEDPDVINDPCEPNELARCVTALSYLMDGSDFIHLITSYHPSASTSDITTKEDRRLCRMHKAIAASVRNVVPPSLALETVLQFCKGDYLNLVQKSLYAIAHNVAETKLKDLLGELRTRAVSVRKHSIYLTFNVCSKDQIDQLIKQLKGDGNSSIRKSLFKGTFNLFINNPDEYTWNLLKENVEALDVNDNEAFQLLTKWKKIPTSFLDQYVVFAWRTLNKLPPKDGAQEKLSEVLDAVTKSVIPRLPEEFCAELVRRHLFQPKDVGGSFQTKIQLFACKYIIYCHSEIPTHQEKRLVLVFEILQNYWRSSGQDVEACGFARKSIFSFVQKFCYYFLERKCLTTSIFAQFVLMWENFLQPQQALNEYFYLHFTLAYLELKHATPEEIGGKLVALYYTWLEIYGSVIMDNFGKVVKLFLGRFLLSDEEDVAEANRYELLEGIVKMNKDDNRFMVVVFFLPAAVPATKKLKVRYDGIIGALLKVKDAAVQIYFHNYLHGRE